MRIRFQNQPNYYVKPYWCLSLEFHWHDGLSQFFQIETMVIRRRIALSFITRE